MAGEGGGLIWPISFDKSTILAKLREKASAKGFNLNPDRGQMSKGVPTIVELLDSAAEAISDILHEQSTTGTMVANNFRIGPAGLQKPVAYKDGIVRSDATTDPKFWSWMEAFHAFLVSVYPEPGNGSPDVFNNTLKGLISQKPTSLTAKIITGSGSVRISI